MKWNKETPTQEGYYWLKYSVGKFVRKDICHVARLKNSNLVHTFRGTAFFEGPNHGGWGLKCIQNGKVKRYKSIRFGPKIVCQ